MFVLILFLLILSLIYIWFIIRFFIKRKFFLGFSIILVPVLITGSLFLYSHSRYIGLTKDIYSIDYTPEKHVLFFDTKRDFRGYGFSLKVDSLKASDIQYFKNAPVDFFNNYPKRHYHIGNYAINKWKKTEISPSDARQYVFIDPNEKWALISKTDSIKISPYLNLAKALLKEQGNYYAYFFRGRSKGLDCMDMYIISYKHGLIIEINKQ